MLKGFARVALTRVALIALICSAGAVAGARPALAQQGPGTRGKAVTASGERRVAPDGRLEAVASRATSPIHLDGVLDEPAWAGAESASGFVQAEPHEGDPASERTRVRIVYDDDYLYVGAEMDDRDPQGIIVHDIRKDFQQDDQDTFELILDTFADRRNGYVFITNPAGGRADEQIANEGKEINTSWDAPWQVRTRRTAAGWTAEMAIPFRALRAAEGAGHVWGVNFSRRIRRRNEIDYWSPIPRSYTLSRVSLAGDLSGLAATRSGRDLRVKPYVAARTTRETGLTDYGSSGDVGVDVKYGLTDALTLDLTVNPDFAQAEADEQQVNLTQFSQFFPEKREFFLENSGVFYVGDAGRNNRVSLTPTPDEDLLLFFSRRIGLDEDGRPVPIRGGARVTGRAGAFSVGALALRTAAAAGGPGNDYAVVRVKRDLFSNSDVGALFQTREGADGDYNRVYGADANFRLPGQFDWSSYAVQTRTPGVSDGQFAWRSTVMREGNFTHIKAGVMSIGEGFRDDIGYYRRTDSRKWILDAGLRPRPKSLQRLGIREMHPHVTWSYYEDQTGRITGKNLHSGYTFFMNSGAYWEVSVNPEYERIDAPLQLSPDSLDAPLPAGGYAWHTWQVKGSTDPSRAVSLSMAGIVGGLWGGDQKTVNATVTIQPSYRFRATVGAQRTRAVLDQPDERFVRSLWTARASYSFSTRAFLDALAQYDPQLHQLDANVRFDLIHHPLSDLFLVYNERRITTPGGIPPGRSIIVKATQMVAF